MEEFKTNDPEKPACPYCGDKITIPEEYFSSMEEDITWKCNYCGKLYILSRTVTVEYSTSKLESK